MNAYNPLASMKRLEQAGSDRQHAEAIAAEIGEGTDNLVTKDYLNQALESALSKQTIRITAVMAAILTLACTVIGTVMALLATR